jgi:hypothetical protein
MESEDWITSISNISLDSSTTVYNVSDYLTDTIDLSSLDITTVTIDENRYELRNSGKIPVDIWAKIYNNGKIDD